MSTAQAASGEEAITTRERILRESSRLFAARGYYGSSTRDIAAAVGIRQPSLFHHFESKQEVLKELLSYSLEDSVTMAEYAAGAEGSPAARLYRFLIEDFRYLMDSPYDLRSLFSGDLLFEEEFAEWGELDERLRRAIAELIRQAIDAGEFIEIDVDFASHTVLGLMLETIRERAEQREELSTERPARTANFLLRAFLRDPNRLEAVAAEGCAFEGLPVYRDVR